MRILLTGTQAENEVFIFNAKIFNLLLLGGVCEFLGSTLMLFSYRSALAANINQGICSSMLSITSITVTIASYYIYRERVYCIQLFGILLIVISICLIVFFTPINSIIYPYFGTRIIYYLNSDNVLLKGGMFPAIIYSVFAVVFFTIRAILIRYLDIKGGIPGDITAFCYLFFEGCIGTVCFVFYSAMGFGIYDIEGISTYLVISAGVMTTLGLVLQDYAVSIGIAGITFSIVNFSIAIQTVIS